LKGVVMMVSISIVGSVFFYNSTIAGIIKRVFVAGFYGL